MDQLEKNGGNLESDGGSNRQIQNSKLFLRVEFRREFMKRFLNKKALVTGGASGIGKAICQRLVEEGASLVFIDRNIEAGKAFEQELSNQESSSLFVAADLTNEDEVERGFHETKKSSDTLMSLSIMQVGHLVRTIRKQLLKTGTQTWL